MNGLNRFTCATIVFVLYFVLIFATYFPVVYLFFGRQALAEFTTGIFKWYGIFVIVLLGICQYSLLYLPLKDNEMYVFKKRHVLIPIITSSLLMGILLGGIFLSLSFVAFGEDAVLVNVIFLILTGLVVILSWIFWALRFKKSYHQARDMKEISQKTTSALKKGSILEWLVAVTCHIIVRCRSDCSAPYYTFFAILAGLAIGFMAFGPGLCYAFLERKNNMMSKKLKGSKPQSRRKGKNGRCPVTLSIGLTLPRD